MKMRQKVPSRPALIAPHAGSNLPHVPRAVNHLNRNYMRQTGSANTSATAVPVTPDNILQQKGGMRPFFEAPEVIVKRIRLACNERRSTCFIAHGMHNRNGKKRILYP